MVNRPSSAPAPLALAADAAGAAAVPSGTFGQVGHRHHPGGPGWRGLWATYGALCLIGWCLYAMAGTDWARGSWHLWEGAYDATLSLWAPMVLGAFTLPWVSALQAREVAGARLVLGHAAGAAVFIVAWQALEWSAAWALFGADHAGALLRQRVAWRAVWGLLVYLALVFGFGGALHARRAQQAAVLAAKAEAARVRAELAAIQGKLNPHFLFNTLNSLLMLTRRDSAAAEDALLRFARMMRHVLDSTRAQDDRVTLREELDFVRDHLALESLRLGPRLRVRWALDDDVQDALLPPLTLQPLVENAVQHGLAPRVGGGELQITARRDGPGLHLRVADDGQGCTWPPPAGARRGVGLAALERRFALDYGGRARMQVRSSPGQGFAVDLWLPLDGADG